jgi:glutamyl-Q tRNA(Asp) synthetase
VTGARYRGRFAPSPTGPLHFGSLLAAVGSYLQARQAGGDWLIRIEDLDAPRVAPGAADRIVAALDAFGFEWSGAIVYQSRRLHLYAEALERLRISDCLYECSCSRAQIAAAAGDDPDDARYLGTCRERTAPHHDATAWRMCAPESAVEFVDRIQGAYSQNVAAAFGDFVVRRRDGIFAYHLAVVVDDADQGVTEVVRGADLLASTPRQIALQRALHLATPGYCHLPLAVDAEGRKLSKSSQSQAVEPTDASRVLWHALFTLGQNPPTELSRASPQEIWRWAIAHWTLAPLTGVRECRAPPADSQP